MSRAFPKTLLGPTGVRGCWPSPLLEHSVSSLIMSPNPVRLGCCGDNGASSVDSGITLHSHGAQHFVQILPFTLKKNLIKLVLLSPFKDKEIKVWRN